MWGWECEDYIGCCKLVKGNVYGIDMSVETSQMTENAGSQKGIGGDVDRDYEIQFRVRYRSTERNDYIGSTSIRCFKARFHEYCRIFQSNEHFWEIISRGWTMSIGSRSDGVISRNFHGYTISDQHFWYADTCRTLFAMDNQSQKKIFHQDDSNGQFALFTIVRIFRHEYLART